MLLSAVIIYTQMARLHHHLRNAFIPHAGNDYRPHALRRRWIHVYAAVIIGVKIISVVAISLYAGIAKVADVTPASIISLTNQTRQQSKVSTLKANTLLARAAESKAQDMINQQYFAHVSPTGVTPWKWFKQAGYAYTYAGENLALDFISGEDVIAAWLKSPSHRRNLLGTKYKDIGVAVVTGKINGVSSLIVVQMFGAPTPAPATKKVTVPAQTPSPTATKQQIAATPSLTKVLGEAVATVVPPVAPEVPTIVTPSAESLVRTAQPEVVGRAEPGSVATLYVNGARVATATVDSAGVYALVPSEALAEGATTIQVSATARGLTSGLSALQTVTVDTQPPAVEVQRSLILPSYLVTDGYDAIVEVTGQPLTVAVTSGGRQAQLVAQSNGYIGTIQLPAATVAGAIRVQAADQAGNQVQTILADPGLFTTGVVSSTSGPFVSALRVIFYSRAFMSMFLVALLIMACLNIFVQWRHQHHPTIVASLLVIFLGGTLMIM